MIAKYFTDISNVYGYAIASGIKQKGLDLAFIYVPTAVACAAVFTQHKFKASSVTYTQKCVKQHVLKAVVINSGNANAVTGVPGERDTKEIAQLVAKLLDLSPKEVGVSATGIIGQPLPMDKLRAQLPTLLSNPHKRSGKDVANAILTTDLVEKTVWIEKKIGKKTIVIAGITKGSGMIAPNMATTLSYFVTNVNLNQETLQKCFAKSIEKTFNMMSVDTDTSTSDMALCFATGEHSIAQHDAQQLHAFQSCLDEACLKAAIQIAKDGEGATTLIEVNVLGAASYKDARLMAKSVCDSPLVKTAIHGQDPNWGRIVMALGKIPEVKLNPKKVTVSIGEYDLMKMGTPTSINRTDLKKELEKEHVSIMINLNIADSKATAWGCDLTKGYIDINTDYN